MCKGKFFIRHPPLIYFGKGGGGYVRKSVFLPYVDLSKVHHHWDPKPIAQGGAGGVGSPSTASPQVIHSLSTDCPHIHNLRTGYAQVIHSADRLDGGCRGRSAGQPCAARPTGRRAHGEGA